MQFLNTNIAKHLFSYKSIPIVRFPVAFVCQQSGQKLYKTVEVTGGGVK